MHIKAVGGDTSHRYTAHKSCFDGLVDRGLKVSVIIFAMLGFPPGRCHALMAGLAETGGGLLLALGLFTPLAAALIFKRDACRYRDAEPRSEFSGVEQFFPFLWKIFSFPLEFLITGVTSKVTVKVIL